MTSFHHQPEAQHPNLQLSTSSQADYPIYLEAGKQTTSADMISKAQAVLSDSELLRAIFDVGYFPPNTPPDE